MKKICEISGYTEDEFFKYFINNLKENKITKWDYFINWEKVLKNIAPIETELNLLNSLIGKTNFEEAATKLILQYPQVIRAIPKLLAIRDNSIEVLVDVGKFVYSCFDFSIKKPTDEQAREFALFLVKSGVGNLLTKQRIKSLPDYLIGVEAGLDSNARKNRTGKLMEDVVEVFIKDVCAVSNAEYIAQATARKISEEWNVNIDTDKSTRRVDFAILKRNPDKLYFVETNFYGGGGSKLKSTAGEYITMNKFWNDQGIDFIWITDGSGWKSTEGPLREYFDRANYLLNLKLLQDGYLYKILQG